MDLSNLTPDEKKQLKEYINSVKEIKKSIQELLEKTNVNVKDLEEVGGNMSKDLVLKISK